MNMLNLAQLWIKDRIQERTSWDGAVLIAAGGSFILLEPLTHVVAYMAIIYGAWTLWKKEETGVNDIHKQNQD
jgi:hypothetical protein